MKLRQEKSIEEVIKVNRLMIIRILCEKFNMPEEKALEFLNESIETVRKRKKK